MPMYEYECHSCGARFELLRSMNQPDTGIACAACHSADVQRALSRFAAVHKESSAALSSAGAGSDFGGGCCSGGSCGCNFSPN